MEEDKKYYFTSDEIGEALAYVVSQVEGTDYIWQYVHYWSPGWTQGLGYSISRSTKLSIVKAGYENLYFVGNRYCPWMVDKISHPIECIYTLLSVDNDYYRKYDPYKTIAGDFEDEFKDDPKQGWHIKVNPFPYLNDFINLLVEARENGPLTKETIFQLAMQFASERASKKERS